MTDRKTEKMYGWAQKLLPLKMKLVSTVQTQDHAIKFTACNLPWKMNLFPVIGQKGQSGRRITNLMPTWVRMTNLVQVSWWSKKWRTTAYIRYWPKFWKHRLNFEESPKTLPAHFRPENLSHSLSLTEGFYHIIIDNNYINPLKQSLLKILVFFC